MVSTRPRKAPARRTGTRYPDRKAAHDLYPHGPDAQLRGNRRAPFHGRARSTGRRISASGKRPPASASAPPSQPDDQMTATHRGPRPEHRQGHAAGPDDGGVPRARKPATARAGAGACTSPTFPWAASAPTGSWAAGIPIAVGSALSQRLQKSPEHHGLLLRRRGDEHGLVPRVGEPRLGLEAAGAVRLREQPLRHVHSPPEAGEHPRPRPAGPGVRNPQRVHGRQRRGGHLPAPRSRRGSTCRKNGPMLLVLNTYRHMGHSKSDANVYRTKQEIEDWKKRCPIKRMRDRLIAEGDVHGRGAGRHRRAGGQRTWRRRCGSPRRARTPGSKKRQGMCTDERNHVRGCHPRGAVRGDAGGPARVPPR